MSSNDVIEKICIPLISVLIGATITFLYQKHIQTRNDKRIILATLMAYRHAGASEIDFVKALNMIDIIFHDSKTVREKLRKYLNYTSHDAYKGGLRLESFFELVLEMAKDIGYTSLKLSEIKDFYVPAQPEQNPPSDKDSH